MLLYLLPLTSYQLSASSFAWADVRVVAVNSLFRFDIEDAAGQEVGFRQFIAMRLHLLAGNPYSGSASTNLENRGGPGRFSGH
ncbi:hypothetical protein WAI453_001271 [Rhynchosporium graminicola]